MGDKIFRGVFPYLVSPLDKAGRVKARVLADLVEHLVAQGVHGLTPLGSTGEFAYLTWPQRRRVVDVVLEAASGRIPVVAGVAHTSTREAVRQARELESAGVDGILAIMESYFPVNPSGIISYFTGVAQAVSCPVVLYTNPSFSSSNLTVEILTKLARVPNIQYLKDASADTGNLLTIMKQVGGRMHIFSASAHIPLFVMMLGGVGWMAGPACVIPRASVRLYDLAQAGKWEKALELQKRLWALNHVFKKYSLAACIKAGLKLQGFAVGDPVPPQFPLSESGLAEVCSVLQDLEALPR